MITTEKTRKINNYMMVTIRKTIVDDLGLEFGDTVQLDITRVKKGK